MIDENINNEIKYEEYDTVVLSGGSTTGFILLGALQHHYDQKHITNNTINFIGTSVGSILTFLLCIGFTPIELMVSLCTHDFMSKLENINIMNMVNGNGATSWQPVHAELEKLTIDKIGYLPTLLDIHSKFKKNFCCPTYNLTEGRVEYLSYNNYPQLPCLTAIRMSSNLPLVFEKFKYGNNFYIDGGIIDNFPVEFAQNLELSNKILGINIRSSNISDMNTESFVDLNFLEYLYKILWISINDSINVRIKKCSEYCDILNIRPISDRKAFDFNITTAEKMNMFTHGFSVSKQWRK
tara:strand:- start:4723 stop:5610 length:888 start_codon:yes stop_codon:yes gene_type:complete